MSEEERKALGEKRRRIFTNVANGVPLETIMQDEKCSNFEIEKTVDFVGKKIKEYRFRRMTSGSAYGAPPIECGTLFDARLNRRAALETLGRLGSNALSSELLLPKITLQRVDEHDIPELKTRLRGKR